MHPRATPMSPATRRPLALVFLLGGLVAALGCASVPKEQLAAAEFGEPPRGYELRIKGYFGVDELSYAGWVTPDWRFGEPYRAALRRRHADDWAFGHAVDVRFNRKRDLQGYAYNERHRFFFGPDQSMHDVERGDRLVEVE